MAGPWHSASPAEVSLQASPPARGFFKPMSLRWLFLVANMVVVVLALAALIACRLMGACSTVLINLA
jgi:hypothetical protein